MTPQGTGAMGQKLDSDEVDVAVMLSEGAVARIVDGSTTKVWRKSCSWFRVWKLIKFGRSNSPEAIFQIRQETSAHTQEVFVIGLTTEARHQSRGDSLDNG
ncbi:unnamed protein product [Symbiodinium sp. CCMP2456]|nr:unnamed protein product [Symbiodinium sp. CCMP2456]